MEKTGKISLLGSLTIIVSVGILTYGVVLFGRSLERCSQSIRNGMASARTLNIPNHITFDVRSNSLEIASTRIADGIRNANKVQVPSDLRLRLDDGSGIKVNLHKTGN